MRIFLFGISLAAVSVAADAQEQAPTWEFFEQDGGMSGALVKGAGGSQLVLKCDKPGRREVHAIVMSPSERLAVPNSRPISRPITFQFDNSSPETESWGFYEHHAIAQGKTSDRALARFVADLRGASNVKMRLDTGIGRDIELEFNTVGAEQAIAQVYETCDDNEPS